ncbi:ring-cleaving dioxygenase [Dolosicoccus paucivorans]|uniref:Ring-cleaving dioxygenase n=1 Tax=Dolosicoccus paucivorans TaxID=84521 RepID=A0A2N6SMH8_9LACT|nr:ring-cleaving dioxygenase [Dolosicoccus paucivorans]PMB84023.1 ring-cleaving dioxygenase [Dolosicoccus paucivorans]PMC58273.1 ring-cleaving dioxygenase [Dolosicoccus paucivorans]
MKKSAITGIHHVADIASDSQTIYQFITAVLSMRLVKKTVNQDDIQTYHTFFADDQGSPGTDLTFFDFIGVPRGISGTNEISRIGLRVPSDKALDYYQKRFDSFDVKYEPIEEMYGAKTLAFEDSDGQLYRLFSDEHNTGVEGGIPWKEGPVPPEYAIYGLGPIEITVSYYDDFIQLMKDIYRFRVIDSNAQQTLLEVGKGGHGAQMIVRHDEATPIGFQGYGEVHHVAFRVPDHEAIKHWQVYYDNIGLQHSGLVDRFYFEALYTRIGHILIEISTDGPGFMVDEPYETLGESLSLPPFLRPQRKQIEAEIRPFDTSRHS